MPGYINGLNEDGSELYLWRPLPNGGVGGQFVKWTLSGGYQVMATYAGEFNVHESSNDGSMWLGIVPRPADGFYDTYLRSTSGLVQQLPDNGTYVSAFDMSGDGTTVVGISQQHPDVHWHAVKWVNGGAFQYLAPGYIESRVSRVNRNGSVAVGEVRVAVPSGAIAGRAAMFAGGAVRILDPNQDLGYSVAHALSDDGSVVIGEVYVQGRRHIFRWTADVGTGRFEDLGEVDGEGWIYNVDPEGEMIILDAPAVNDTYVWRRETGFKRLENVLESLGYDHYWWRPHHAFWLSGDGTTLVGYDSIDFGHGGWRAVLWTDKDKDGLHDDWELNGIPYGTGTYLRYSLPGASVLRKDLYVEIDSMDTLAPNPSALSRVVAAFDSAPVSAPVGVVGGLPGIALHVVVDEDDIPLRDYYPEAFPGPVGTTSFDKFHQDKASHFGTPSERLNSSWSQMKLAKAAAYRYCIFAYDYDSAGHSSGRAEGIHCNDFMVTLGHSAWQPVSEEVQAGTFMHELGHTLGLRHGGADDIHKKPNYYSVMNYLWQFPFPQYSRIGLWELRYSNEVLPTLNEGSLFESIGIGANFPGRRVPFTILAGQGGCPAVPPGSSHYCDDYASMAPGAPVDWSMNGAIDSPGSVAVNLNAHNPLETTNHPVNQSLVGFNDWLSLKYSFRSSGHYMDGVPATDIGHEMTVDDVNYLRSLPWPCTAEFNADGVVNSQDFFDFQTAFFAGDPIADINHDGFVNSQDFFDFLTAMNQGC